MVEEVNIEVINKKTFKEYMTEEKPVSRSIILIAGLIGMIGGAFLMFIFMLLGIVG